MTFTNRFRRIDVCLPAALCLCGVLGCATFTTPAVAPLGSLPSVGDLIDREEPIAEPKGVAVVWTDAVFQKEASQPTRGFGGMVTFYGTDRKKPIRVDGQLTVYGYDDMSADEEDPVPDRKYVFKPEQLAKHYGEGPLGPSYSIWIPWDAAGGPRKAIGLIARFDSKEGTTVMSKPTHNVLEGAPAVKKPVNRPDSQTPDRQSGDAPTASTSPDSVQTSFDGESTAGKEHRTDASSRPGLRTRPFGNPENDKPKMKTVTLSVPPRHQKEARSNDLQGDGER